MLRATKFRDVALQKKQRPNARTHETVEFFRNLNRSDSGDGGSHDARLEAPDNGPSFED
jgi:hypothetical protein